MATWHLDSYGWYLNCLTDNTSKLEHGLREKLEGMHLDKPTSTDSYFRGGKKNHSAKKLKKTKDQSVRPLSDKHDEEDLEQKEPLPIPKVLQSRIVHRRRQLLNIDIDPSLDLLQNPIPNPIKFSSSHNSLM
jgi:hypothetical protein